MSLAFDRSARTIDADGRLHVALSHISKATVNPYYGREIPGGESMGLEPDRIYQLLRDPEELAKAAPTFARLPVLKKHVPVTVDTPQPDLIVGAIGSDIAFNAPYLDADICVWDAGAIAGIETGQVQELSCAYRYEADMTPGEFEGVKYDGRMTNIRGNHLALVEVGRAGRDVVVADADPFPKKPLEICTMKMTRLGAALFRALSLASPVLAADSALVALVGQANRRSFKPELIKEQLLATDSSLDPQQVDNLLDAMLDVEQSPVPLQPQAERAAADEGPGEMVSRLLTGLVDQTVIDQILAAITPAAPTAQDGDKPDELKAAMDAYSTKLRAELAEAATAREDVRGTVGAVLSMDSASEIYTFALDHLGIDHADITDTNALRALFKLASRPAPVAAPVASNAATVPASVSRINVL